MATRRISRRSFLGLGATGISLGLATTRAGRPTLAAAQAPAVVRKGGTLNMALGMEMTIFDPVVMTGSPFKGWHRFMLYNSLLRWDKTVTKFQPELAESWSNPDDKTMIFKLRAGVKWHDGSEFTAEDCKDTFDRALDPKVGSPYGPRFVALEKAEVVDKLTLKLVLKRPSAMLVDAISAIAMTKRGSTKDSLTKKPVGTGPFKFVEYVANDRLVAERNPEYWRKGLPLLDRIVIKPITDKAVAFTNLKAGALDFVFDITPAQAKELRGSADFRVGEMPRMSPLMMLFNSNTPPFTDKRVRQAAMMCLDKKAVADMVFDGEGVPGFTPMPSEHWSTAPGLADYPYDPVKARERLKEAGLKPEDVPFTTSVRIGRVQEIGPATVWQNGLAKIGWQLKIDVVEPSIWLDRWWGGGYQSIINGAFATPEPVTFYQQVVVGDMILKAKSYTHPEFEPLVARGDSILDQEKRKPIFHRLSQIMVDDLPMGHSVRQKIFWAYHRKVQGFWVNDVADGESNLEEATIG